MNSCCLKPLSTGSFVTAAGRSEQSQRMWSGNDGREGDGWREGSGGEGERGAGGACSLLVCTLSDATAPSYRGEAFAQCLGVYSSHAPAQL